MGVRMTPLKVRMGPAAVLAAALLTTLLEYAFHFFETSPLEVPAYFVAIFAFAALSAALIPRVGLPLAAVVFALVKGVYYTIVVALGIPSLTVWSQGRGFEVLGVYAWGSWMSLAALEVAGIETVVHFLVFLIGAGAVVLLLRE